MTSSTTTPNLDAIDAFFHDRTDSISKDLKLNLKKALTSSLDPETAFLTLLSGATLVKHKPLADAAQTALSELGTTDEVINEAIQTAALGTMLNVYYRFRHFIDDTEKRYQRTGLRMNALAKPVMGHTKMEAVVFALSVINGCEMCVNGHEAKLRDLELSDDAIHDLARLGALIAAIRALPN